MFEQLFPRTPRRQRSARRADGAGHRKLALVCLLLLALPSGVAVAGTNGWSYGNYNNGSYVPRSGSFYEHILSGDLYRTWVEFSFDSHNVTNILDYNNGGDNPGDTDCENKNAYVTVDVTAKVTWDMLHAFVIYSNLPDFKPDVENDVGTWRNEESDVVALGAVASGVTYYMRTYWDDDRTCGAGESGNIEVQFSMSNTPWWTSDYNNCVTAGAVQVINSFGACKGSL